MDVGTDLGPVDDLLEVHRDDERGLVTVRGAVDLVTVQRFETHLADAAHRTRDDLVVDLTATTFLCVRGSRALASCRDALAAQHRRLVLRGASRSVRRVVDLCTLPHPPAWRGPGAAPD